MSDRFADSPILLWHMGKVGSTSIWKALQDTKLNPIQIQFLDRDRIDLLIREYEARGMVVPDYVYDALRSQALINNPNENLRVISLVRDPIARNFSELFESRNAYPPFFSELDSPSRLAEWFFINFNYSVQIWFDQEIYRETGIDVYNSSFDHERKRILIETERISLLVLRSEDSVADKERNLNEFFQVSKVKIDPEPSIYIKPNAPLRESMRSLAKASSAFIEKVYCSKMVEHFYTTDEIDRFKQSWSPSRDRT